MLQMLQVDRAKRGREAHWLDADDIHILVESMRLAYADRATHLGDPAFYNVPMKMLLDHDYLAGRYASIDPTQAKRSKDVSAGQASPPEPDETTHLTIVDREGNVVSLTQTINYSWGSGVVVPHTGVLLNNEMDDFSAAPGVPNSFGLVGGEANSVQAKKIPLSSMSPTIVTKDGALRLALGSPGGATIITTVLQIMLHVIDYGLDIGSAISSPRIHHQWLPDRLRLEEGALTPQIEKTLRQRGHTIQNYDGYWGDATGIEILSDGTRRGATDPRGDGAVVAE
jgi:gamma-glutamyltranspeptidase/glutathione hydrolase